MAEICRFFGIIITIFNREHGIPHFHVKYGEYRAVFSIEQLEIIEGILPNRIISLVLKWAFQHREELKENWDLAQGFQPLQKIKPLD
jgi:hypothetical protein